MRQFLFLLVFALTNIASAQQKIDKDYVALQLIQGNEYTLLVLHPTGIMPPDDSLRSWRMQHLTNLFQMQADKKSSIFGPVSDPKADIGGIIIFNTSDTLKVKSWISGDPFIRGNIFTYKLYPWFSIPDQKLLPSEKAGHK